MNYEWIAPCHFGLESVCKREILDLGYEIVSVEDGKVMFRGDEMACVRANIFLRTCERILLHVGTFKAETWDELFEGTKALAWEAFIPQDGRFWVTKANSVKSRLFSPSDIQSIMKKAMVERLKSVYGISWFKEEGASYPVRVSILKDMVTVGIDTSGVSLHKRGYRKMTAKAPITETLAAALIMLTPWKADRILVDPFCGSGTFPIEAAMIAANIAPGLNREFTAESWTNFIPKDLWYKAIDEAENAKLSDIKPDIQGYDIDADVIKAARSNAYAAGVEDMIHFQVRDVAKLSHPKKYGFIITNPPYGERVGAVIGGEADAGTNVSANAGAGANAVAGVAGSVNADIFRLYQILGERYKALDDWSMFMITSYENAEKAIGKKADKNRKIYNGMMKTYFYSFMGPKPPRGNQA